MRTARLAEAAHEHVVGSVEKEHDQPPRRPGQRLDGPQGLIEKAPDAHVEPERNRQHASGVAHPYRLRHDRRRKVIYAVKAEVRQRSQRRRLSGTGQTGDDDNLGRTIRHGLVNRRSRAV